ncbi:MAG: FtsW/RodA/SpoVE family cell cycle protein, partial [Clostridia bacterium]|nr:FtsW/RodA/SpoVE family cell cycle protein [Clostridia bacterium]
VAVVAVIFFIKADDILEGYAFERIRIWLKLLTNEELTAAETSGSGWQSLQSLYAIGSGGLFGLGFGNSRQKHMYLPEPQNDFVFAIVCEELGFLRAILIIALFILLVARGFVIGLRAKSKFGALLAMGISFHVGLQAALNMAVVTATVPNTGISLPFFSYGGTSLVMLLVEMGIVLAISRNGERKSKDA